ncbi:glycosyl hydrolase family 2 [Niastella yeongjuensis]|uniref:beta-galactosidase n=1 Tax=Niastella yeongjuensis TaxID=354355 RepID=A0A1V9EA00_9BACT|nr:glycoside hydrolase family 2 TIM barrel-domain containing protein [Niastella yeongjuensis]OQP42919.1 glycosyl hydrolase family 2 [Niastella yeongjuensis]SEO59444.1 Glycosyl hydrolases family 2 [Niastella yeongjuensis]
MKKLVVSLLLLSCIHANSQTGFALVEQFNSQPTFYEKTGRGTCKLTNGILSTQEAYASFGTAQWTNYAITFKARSQAGKEEVQIWAGFREYNRNDRYVIGLRGGLQNNLYLSRMGYMGTDEFLALRPLDFHPVANTWYTFRIEVCDNRIRVFLNNETLPRIDVTDKNSRLAPSGKVILGGGWLPTDYDDLAVKELPDDYFKNIPRKEYSSPQIDKEKKRVTERKAYQAMAINKLSGARTTVSLNGQWLFMPVYELANEQDAVSPSVGDKNWHSMHVPDFWNPIRIWLHGETFGPHSKGVSDVYYRKETERCENYTFDYQKTNAAWYRQWIELPAGIQDKETELAFDAVSKVAEVWINGSLAGKHTGMFGDFKVNGKGLFKPGKNLVAVKVIRDYVKDVKDANKVIDVAVSVEVTNKMLKDLAHGFYGNDPAGIWQPVSLVITDPLKIKDVFIQPSLTGATFDITIANTSKQDKTFSIATNIADKKGSLLYKGDALPQTVLHAGEEKKLTYSVKDLKPLLWSPQTPNLYDFTFSVLQSGRIIDSTVICSGFRTFESKNGYFWLNGKQYWLRGGNQTPFALAPNDRELADRFYEVMKAGNMEVTRTHTAPYNELWMDAADRKGIGVSFEGTWPWLMLASSMPDRSLIDLWADEFMDMLKKFRNHPSLLFWTVNNEMKFYDNEPDLARAKEKMTIISEVVKRMRAVDPTRPMCFDSNYKRKGKAKRFGDDFMSGIDDGDIDDVHSYINWYDYNIFKMFNGEFQQENWTAGRPLISQEMSTGYPNGETGHPTRFYTLVHQTPQSLIGDLAYEYNNPAYFLEAQSFITGELAEALRRSNDKAAGFIHFALLTWFRSVYDAKKIEPYPAYYAMQRAMQPILVSAELWGRHFYEGAPLPVRICVANDRTEGTELAASVLEWKLVGEDGKLLQSGTQPVNPVAYYGREWVTPPITLPANLPQERVNAKLLLSLKEKGKEVSANEYKLVLARKEWNAATGTRKIVLVDRCNLQPVFDFLNLRYTAATDVNAALQQTADVYVLAGIDSADLNNEQLQRVRSLVAKGGKLLLLNGPSLAKALYPEYIRGWFKPTEGEIVNMDIPESPVFDGLALMDLRYFNNNKREIPTVCNSVLKVNRAANVELLAKHIRIHGYINGEMPERAKHMETIQGTTIMTIKDNGKAMVSTMSLEKGATDPVAGKLLVNMLNYLMQ